MPEPIRRAALFVLLLLTVAAAAAPAEKPQDVDLQWGVRIPMRDGVELAATVYLPAKPARQQEALPVVFTLTPYIGDSYHPRAMYFARHGYVYVLVDVRGRGSSGGTFDPFAQESRDGYDVVEWLARQAWSNGKVAMWGGSYAGYDQWATARERPPHLTTIVPAASVRTGVDFPAPKNIFYSYAIQWLTFTSGKTGNAQLFGESSFWIQKYREMYLNHRPFRELDRITGNPNPVFQRWVAHPAVDDFWKSMTPSPEQFAKIDLPILTITGHYDGDQGGALSHYREHMRLASPAARDRHYLIIGPWDHPGTRTPVREVGGLTFDPASVLDLNDLHRQWYDWTMKSGPQPAFLKKRVAYYVVGPGAEEWKYADSLEEIGARKRTLYLASENGGAGDAYHSGALADTKTAGAAEPDRWIYDPLDVRPGEELERGGEGETYLTDQRGALNLYGNGAVYHSAPFAEATEVSGQVRLSLWIALDVPDTDFQASLYEILPNGKSVLLTSDSLRARYRDSLEKERLVPKGEIVRYDFTGFSWFSRRVSQGSRLRLVVSCPNSIGLEKNYNSGGVVADETAKDARTAHVVLYHDAEHPSALEIPIVK
ncbi:MAG TPA: CocE/NonD family hydrolase [Thermoanaerobaculia bacterium]|nr:CocE/NonD family hydrolase [Thermoanaerobaculia bacterium]